MSATHALVYWLVKVKLACLAPLFTLSLGDGERTHKRSNTYK